MKILFIHQHFYPEPSGTAKSCTEMAEYFLKEKNEITVITEFPNRNFNSTVNIDKLKSIGYYKGIKIHRLKNKFRYSSNTVSRISAYLYFTFYSFFYAKKLKQQYDLCITIQALPSAIPGVLLQKVNGIPHHFYCTDMMPDLGIVSGMVKNKLIIWLSCIVEKYVYDNSTAVYAVSDLMAENIHQKSKNPNIFTLPDWIDNSLFYNKRHKYVDELRLKYNLDGKKIILYIGNVGLLQNLGTIIHVAQKMRMDDRFQDFKIIIGGNGVEKERLENEAKKLGVDNIRFIGVVDRQKVPSLLKLSSYCFMNFINHPHMALYRSSKIFDYIMAEKPVIVGAEGELAKIVLENKIGVVARPSDPDHFLQKLVELTSKIWNIDNKKLIQKYSRDSVLQDFKSHIEKLLNNKHKY